MQELCPVAYLNKYSILLKSVSCVLNIVDIQNTEVKDKWQYSVYDSDIVNGSMKLGHSKHPH